MIYIIDEKKSRQKDFGWDDNKFNLFGKYIMPIWEVEDLCKHKDSIIQDGNVVLFHESFFESSPVSKDFKSLLKDQTQNLLITYFSGSKGSRNVSPDGKTCMLPPDVLYRHLEIFIDKLQTGDFNFRYLAFGENYQKEESLRNRLYEVNAENTNGEMEPVDKNVFFAVTSADDLQVEPPFKIEPIRDWDWDFIDRDISDSDLDKLVQDWFLYEKFDLIYIPLCFGSVLSDYLGLRLAMHIRLTNSVNQDTPIFIYGVMGYEDVKQNTCFDILKTNSVRLIGCDNKSFIDSSKLKLERKNLIKDLNFIHLDPPCNIGGHSLANQWGIDVLARAFKIDYKKNKEINESQKSLYYKYILAKTSKENGDRGEAIIETQKLIDKAKKLSYISKDKKILLIDDEAYNGWNDILTNILKTAPIVINERVSDYESLSQESRLAIERGDFDLIFLDLRLNGVEEEDNLNPHEFSGMKILQRIKLLNKGNQVIMLTASNKAWNMKALMTEGANGYYIKESPEYELPLSLSIQNAEYLVDNINNCLNRCYLRDIYKEISQFTFNDTIDLSETFKESIITQLELSFSLLCKADSEDDFAFSFISLEHIVEIITKEFIREYRWNDFRQYEIDRINVICSCWKINRGNCINTREPWNSSKDYPQWMQMVSIYYQLCNGNDKSFGKRIRDLIDLRNDYIHSKKKLQEQHSIIFNEDGYIDLFNCLFDILEIM